MSAYYELPATPAPQPVNKGRCRSNQSEVSDSAGISLLDKEVLQSFCLSLAKTIVSMGVNKTGQPAEGGIAKLAPIGNFPVIKKGIVMPGGSLNGVVLRRIGLNDHPSP